MQDRFGSVRRSLLFRPNPSTDDPVGGGVARMAEKIGSCLRKSRVGLSLGLGFMPKSPSPPRRPAVLAVEDDAPPIRWRKGELIGCGAFGQVYMGMNLDSGELLAVKQVLIGASNASKEKAQAHIRELEEEVKLLKNLSHPNIVRYLGTTREEGTLNILLEFVPGGSIASLLGKFGSFPEAVIRMYTKQLLQGLEYLHHNGIIHRDIKGANILVDNKGCIKLADFGASKQVAKLATMTAAKSMKGTPYWMAPEVIVQSGHSFSADIWSVGCTIIEMATGKPPWSQQYQEVAALFHVGTTKSHPPIPDNLSSGAKEFLLRCLQEEPSLRPTASELLTHPFVTGELEDLHHSNDSVHKDSSEAALGKSRAEMSESCLNNDAYAFNSCSTMTSCKVLRARPIWEESSDEEMCQFTDNNDFPLVGSSFNPMSEPLDDWPSKFDISPQQRSMNTEDFGGIVHGSTIGDEKGEDFSSPFEAMCEDDEVTETKIRAFLDEKALELKKLQTPLYEFYHTLNATNSRGAESICKENNSSGYILPPKSKSPPSKAAIGTSRLHAEAVMNASPGNSSRRVSRGGVENDQILKEVASQHNDLGCLLKDAQQESTCASFSERQRKWKEELVRELEREREMRLANRTSSPSDNGLNRKRDRQKFASPAK